MRQYYVNEVELKSPIAGCKSDWAHRYVGLFDNNQHEGRGNFCGWYGVESYKNTRLLAFFLYSTKGGEPYNPHRKLSDVHRCGRFFNRIDIGSAYWEKTIFAEDDEDAIRKFENLEF